ncbi:MAG: hypothetical protein IKX54_00420 [Lachnospiraceae bacterium]|nr:hypothetical protein [Lachnospiraceae bacterium]
MKRGLRAVLSILLAFAMVVLALPEYVRPVKTAKAATAGTKTIYELTNELTSGGEYLIVGHNTARQSYALSHRETQATRTAVTIHSAEDAEFEVSQPYIDGDNVEANMVWTAETDQSTGNLMRLQSEGYYLQVEGQGINITLGPHDGSGSPYSLFNWVYTNILVNGSRKPVLRLTYHSTNMYAHDTTRYLRYGNSNFSGTDNPATAANNTVYIYVKKVVTTCEHEYEYKSADWTFSDTFASVKVTYECGKCGDTVVLDADIERTLLDGNCITAPQWKYTAIISAQRSPSEAFFDTKTVTANVPSSAETETATIYVLVDAPTPGGKYLVVDSNDAEVAHMLANGYPAIVSNNNIAVKSVPIDIRKENVTIAGNESEKTYIANPASEAVWTFTADGDYNYLVNNGYYLFHMGGSGANYIYLSKTGEPQYRDWIAEANTLKFVGSSSYYVGYNAGNPSPWELLSKVSNSESAPANVYFFEETEATIPKYVEAGVVADGHSFPLKHHEANEETCFDDGNSEYWECERCGKFFGNSNATGTIDENSWIIKGGHQWKFTEFVWTKDGEGGISKVEAKYVCQRVSSHVQFIDVTESISEVPHDDTDSPYDEFTASISDTASLDGAEYEGFTRIDRYLITFVVEGEDTDEVVSSEYYNEGTPANNIVLPQEPTKEATAQFTYNFIGWKNVDTDEGVSKVTGNATYKADFDNITNQYTVTFIDDDNDESVLKEGEVYDYGTPAGDIEVPSNPTKTETPEFTFEFRCWVNKETGEEGIKDVTGDVTYRADYTETKKWYTVTFVDKDNKTLAEKSYPYGTAADEIDVPDVPVIRTDDTIYTFDGWESDITAVLNTAVYKAKYTTQDRLYTVTFVNHNGQTLYSTSEATFAQATNDEITYPYDTPSHVHVEGKVFTFDKWNKHTAENGDVTYTAEYLETTQTFTITFYNEQSENATVLYSCECDYDTVPVFEGNPNPPQKTSSDQYSYDFNCWMDEEGNALTNGLPAAKADANYYADFTSVPRKYNVTFVVDGSSQTDEWEYNKVPSYGKTVEKEGEDKVVRYEFIGWRSGETLIGPDASLPAVVGEVTYTAEFDTYYYVEISECDFGKIACDQTDNATNETWVKAGEEVTFICRPFHFDSTEYKLDTESVKVTKADGGAVTTSGEGDDYAFTMPESKVTINAAFYRVYLINIGTEIVTDLNKGDVFGDGSVKCEYDEDNNTWTITFNEQPTMLTGGAVTPFLIGLLEIADYKIVTPEDGLTLNAENVGNAIYSSGALTIEGNLVLNVTSDVFRTENELSYAGGTGIHAEKVTFNGDLEITISLPEDASEVDDGYFVGIEVVDSVTFASETGSWVITTPEGGAAILAQSISYPETHGFKVPENAEIGEVPEDDEDYRVTIVLLDMEDDDSTGPETALVNKTVLDMAEEEPVVANVVSIQLICHVVFKNGEETLWEKDFFLGDEPVYDGDTKPTQQADAQYTYTYAGWKDSEGKEYPDGEALPELNGAMTFTAYFESTVNRYTVTFVTEDGKTVLAEKKYDYGTEAKDITVPEAPKKENTEAATYEHVGWNDGTTTYKASDLPKVTGDVTYKAAYSDTSRSYKVTFTDENDKVLSEKEYPYGTEASKIEKPADPTKAEDEKYTYTFKGWTPEISAVQFDVTYKATFEATEKQVEERGEYYIVGEKSVSHELKSGTSAKVTAKRTKNDEKTHDMFDGMEYAGKEVSKDVYTETQGSAIIELKPEYLDTLAEGKHEYTIKFKDGDPVTFTVEILPAKQNETEENGTEQHESPKTADLMPEMTFLFASLILFIGVVLYTKRRREEA